ncbi:hypothetical protein A2963_00330 [Candidatus Roizmanbacteria bacterium RIFCSPLOWO2_01_FULL_40_13]|nr:MAG: hypothetical protein A2963_00330 [Candidatus Roizmanbacteria bacterium RIFCSPLOWO2_01_FULL_40_13]
MITIRLTKKNLAKLPSSPGVYLFKKNNTINYIGKAVSIRARIYSHLQNGKLDRKESRIVKNSSRIGYIITDSEFKALLLESELIQKYKPKYNTRWKDDKSYLYIKVTRKETYSKIFIVRREFDGKSLYFGPFPAKKDAELICKTIRKIYPFCQQSKLGTRRCFYAKIGLCHPCPSDIAKISDPAKKANLKRLYRQNIRQVIRILNGKVELALQDAYRMLKSLGKSQDYEQALVLRDKINLFETLIHKARFSPDTSLNINNSSEAVGALIRLLNQNNLRITKLSHLECYDVSNLLQKQAAASLVVFVNGLPDRSKYRKFKIRDSKAGSDLDMLEEVFRRRLRLNWPKPDLIVVDGGTPQYLRIRQVLKNLKLSLPFIAIAKHPDRLLFEDNNRLKTLRPEANNPGFNLVRHLRDEAHRFARKYHLFLRQKDLRL